MQHSNKSIKNHRFEKLHDPALRELASSLLNDLALDDLPSGSLTSIEADIPLIFNLLNSSSNDRFQVRFNKHNQGEEHTSLIILGPNLPFLIDSILNHLRTNNFGINLISHTTVSSTKNEQGEITSIGESRSNSSIAIMYLHLEKSSDSNPAPEASKEISQILQCLDLSFRDWKEMACSMDEIANDSKSLAIITNTEERSETSLFLKWLTTNNFIFLGSYITDVHNGELEPQPSSYRGICNNSLYPIKKTSLDKNNPHNQFMFTSKWDIQSVIHRTAHMDWLIINRFDDHGKCIGTVNFLGFFTSSVYYQSIRAIPLIRRKVNNVVARYGHPEHSHNCKELITAMEAFPRGELLQMSEDEIYDTATEIASLTLSPRVRLFVRQDLSKKFASCIIFIPQSRFSASTSHLVEKLLCDKFNGTVSKQHTQINDSRLARIQLILKIQPHLISPDEIGNIEAEINSLTTLWSDDLFDHLCIKYGRSHAHDTYRKFKNAFDIKYTSTFSTKQALHDIKFIEESLSNNSVKFCCYISPHTKGKTTLQLKIYSPNNELPLSSTLPKLENLGLYADDMVVYEVAIHTEAITAPVFIYHFHLQPSLPIAEFTPTTIANLVEALYMVWDNTIDNDRFNNLVLNSHLNWRQALIFRSYNSYLKQINFSLTAAYIINTALNYGALTSQLADLFELKFSPDIPRDEKALSALQDLIEKELQKVENRSQEKVMSMLFTLINATKRTNFYQTDSRGAHKNYLSFKIASAEVTDIPLPRPYAEIFVYSLKFRGIHLRGGKVSRGGIRWSDRSEDMRTEILGLMKAQMTKNAVIVPVGSKGGFVLKHTTIEAGREQFMREGIECYRLFLSGLLDITDNIIDGKIVTPNRVVRHDADDPYLVVAADKGTATFSDEANAISQKYNFWLGDAFASGGSAGYDHKKLGITARGAWISVVNHFSDIGMDIEKTEFTVTGIGDMSGDVFGNGMLLSNKIKLVAAFNHQHIFLDPTPNPESSLAERKRLFELPRSQWSDYNPSLISPGGGVFNRNDKHITIAPEVKNTLGIETSSLTPDELISAILKAPVDLLWNGGIGTYIKAENETNEMVGDKANDLLRVNGSELRCKVIGEGGNLGMTQLGRIEYARNGGRLNTDFIDNSAGVDCSDHEVNIKIPLNNLVKSGSMSLEERNILLESMAQEVSELVLQDNKQQALLLSLEEHLGSARLQEQAWLIKYLSDNGLLNCKIEFLPTPETLSVMLANNKQLTRPEIAVLISYAKNSMFYTLSEIDFLGNAIRANHKKNDLEKLASESFIYSLLNYFPTQLRNKFTQDLINHKLGNEIITTVAANSFINMLGCTLFHQLKNNGETPLRIIQAFIIVRKIFDIDTLWRTIAQTNSQDLFENKVSLLSEIQLLAATNLEWVLHHHDVLSDIDSIVESYKPHIPSIIESLLDNSGTFNKIEISLFTMKNSKKILDIINIKHQCNQPLNRIIEAYSAISDRMHFSWMKHKTSSTVNSNYVDKMALKNLSNEIENIHIQLTLQYFLTNEHKELEECAIPYPDGLVQYHKFISDLKAYTGENWVAMMVVALQHAKNFLKETKQVHTMAKTI